MFKRFKKDGAHELDGAPAVELAISNRTVIRVIGLILAAFMLILVVKVASHSLFIVFTAFFLALAMNAPVSFFARHLPRKLKGNRTAGAAVTLLVGVLLLGLFLSMVLPPLVKQSDAFINSVPGLVESARDPNSSVGKVIKKYNLQKQVDTFSDDIGTRLKSAGGSAVKTVGAIGSSLVSLLTIVVLSFMMLTEGPRILEFIREIIPKDKRKRAQSLGMDMYRVVKGFVNGQVTLAAIASILILPALLIFGVDYPFALVFIIFICGLIPLVGHTIGAAIVTLVAIATSSLPHALFVLAWYILYQQIENVFIQPRIQANSTDMSPLLVFISVVVGISFGGLAGGLFAIPVAGCIRIVLLDFLVRNKYITPESAPVVEETAAKAHAA